MNANSYLTDRLLGWYAEHGRQLPWRETKDAYRIWVSEIILQQTRVEQGRAYYHRFLEHFPTVEVLAAADEDEVMAVWQGLGYYSRARNMQKAARQVVEWGEFPHTYADILQMTGVGPYTAAAIASFAFGEPRAVVDGNVYRVLSRYFALDDPIDTSRGQKLFAALAQDLLPDDAAAYNQAVMDFGALVCTPQSPDCEGCPLTDSCGAFRQGLVAHLPVKSHRTKVRDRYFTYFYIRTHKGLLLRKRCDKDIWQGLYELPMVESDHPLTTEQILQVELVHRALSQGAALRLVCQDVRHQLSHQLLHADLYVLDGDIPIDGYVAAESMEGVAVPRLVEILLEKVK